MSVSAPCFSCWAAALFFALLSCCFTLYYCSLCYHARTQSHMYIFQGIVKNNHKKTDTRSLSCQAKRKYIYYRLVISPYVPKVCYIHCLIFHEIQHLASPMHDTRTIGSRFAGVIPFNRAAVRELCNRIFTFNGAQLELF